MPFRLSSTVTILPKSYWEGRSFDDLLLEPPLRSGPYRVAEFTMGEKIVWERVQDYWATNHPSNRGAALPDTVIIDTIRDREALRIAFLAREVDTFQETTQERWVNGYDRQQPLIDAGVLHKQALESNGLRARPRLILLMSETLSFRIGGCAAP